MAVGLIDDFRRLAAEEPDRVAVEEVDGGRRFDRGAVLAEAERLAGVLDEIAPEGATVLLRGPGGAGFWAALLAVFGTGRRLIPLAPDAVDAEATSLVEAHGVAVVLETEGIEDRTGSPDVANVEAVLVHPDARADPGASRLDRGDRACLLLRSSGTTGRPGVAMRTAAALDRVSTTLVGTLGLTDRDRVLSTIPMSHAYGIEHGVLAPMRAGAEVAFKSGFDLMAGAEALLDRTTVFPAVPVTLEAATRIARPDSRLRLVYTAGAPLPDSIRSAFESAWDLPVADLYGMTEVGTITWGFDGDHRAVPGVSIGIVDPEAADGDAVVRRSGIGEIVVSSDAMAVGYVSTADAEPDPGRRVDGHLRTGDLGEIDEAGRVRITGRTKLQFDVGGLKVNPEEVEEALLRIPQVREVAVVPVALSETVNRVMAVLVLENDIGPAGMNIALRVTGQRYLAPHQRPRMIRVVDELPRSPTGKLLRGRLIESLELTHGDEAPHR